MRGAGDSGSRSGRGSVRSCRQFNMQSGSFESGRELGNSPKIVVVLDGPAAVVVARLCEVVLRTGQVAERAVEPPRARQVLRPIEAQMPLANLVRRIICTWAPEIGVCRKWVLRVRDWPSQTGVFGFG